MKRDVGDPGGVKKARLGFGKNLNDTTLQREDAVNGGRAFW